MTVLQVSAPRSTRRRRGACLRSWWQPRAPVAASVRGAGHRRTTLTGHPLDASWSRWSR